MFLCGVSVQGGAWLATLAALGLVAVGGVAIVQSEKKRKLRETITGGQTPPVVAAAAVGSSSASLAVVSDTPPPPASKSSNIPSWALGEPKIAAVVAARPSATEPVSSSSVVIPASNDQLPEVTAIPQSTALPQNTVKPQEAQASSLGPVLTGTGNVTPIGRDIGTGQEVSISQAARLQGLYIIGVNGTGKSTFISNLIIRDIEQGLGVCLLDPHGDLTKDVLSRVPASRLADVILLDLMDSAYPFGLNVFECPDPANIELVALTASFVMHIFEKVWDIGPHTPQLAQVLRNVTFTLIQNPGTTLAELPLLLQDQDVRSKLTTNVTNSQVKLFWKTYDKLSTRDQLERTNSTLNKADAFLTQPIIANIVGQAHTTIDFRKIMDEGKILLVQLSPQLEDLSRLVGAVMIGQLLEAAMSRRDLPAEQRKQFNLYADEYQRFATPDFATLLSEARKFGVATTIAHQYLEQLDDNNRGAAVNAANLVAFRVSGLDAEMLAKEYDATPEESLEFRTEPVRSPVRNVIKHLLEKGHRNQDVTDFVNDWLAPAYVTWENRENIIQIKNKISWIELDEFLKRDDFPTAMDVLNNLLFTCMEQETYELNFHPRMIYTLLFINQVHEGVAKLVKFKPGGSDTVVIMGLSKQPPSLFKSSTEFDTLCKWNTTELQVNRIGDYVTNKNEKKAEKYNASIDLILHLKAVLQALSEDPILVDTGQYREVRDKPRPYTDVQKEVANALSQAPNYTARVKTLAGQGTVKLLPATPGLAGSAFQDRRGQVLEQTHAAYCRPRAAVEEEIADRQTALMEEEEQEPKSRRQQAEAQKPFTPSRRHKTPLQEDNPT
jgi:hypothetical protein